MMKPHRTTALQAGVTLIELIVAIVVIGIAVTSMLSLMSSIAMRSAGALEQSQSVAIARAYLDEILAMSFADPGGPPEVNRSQFDDVQDYAALPDQVPRARSGNPMANLNQYRVAVRLVNNVVIGVFPDTVSATQVVVTVTSPTGVRTVLSGYRTPYAAQVMY